MFTNIFVKPSASKMKNINISKMEKHFIDKINRMQEEIDELDALCFREKTTIKELNEMLDNAEDPHVRKNIREKIENALWRYSIHKEEKVTLIKHRKEIKKLYKTCQKAVEERWLDGFGEGVQFATETYNKN